MAKPGPKGPSIYDKDFHPKSFVDLSKGGKNLTQIARDWDVKRSTIYRWMEKYPRFCDAVERGKEYCESWYTDIGQAAMLNKAKEKDGRPIKVDFQFFKWMTQNVCKWSDKMEQNNVVETKESVVLYLPSNGSEAEKKD